jgi:hypothetical protein
VKGKDKVKSSKGQAKAGICFPFSRKASNRIFNLPYRTVIEIIIASMLATRELINPR